MKQLIEVSIVIVNEKNARLKNIFCNNISLSH